jgi:thiamine-monophosphate kinase
VATEHERIAEIRRRLSVAQPSAGDSLAATVRVSIGDDAAILRSMGRDVVLSVDTAVEGVHFNRAWLSWEELGARCVAAALSDLAAMGAAPRGALVSLICPQALTDAELFALVDGIGNAQHAYACPVIGGNLARGSELSITTTVVGDAPERPLLRSGARAGDSLFITGVLGSAALGLRLLQAGRAELSASDVARWRSPRARVDEGLLLSRSASAAIVVSDGLLQELQHLCDASHVGCTLELAALPLSRAVAAAATVHADLTALALTGGEHYELLCAAPAPPTGVESTRIGSFSAERGIRAVDSHGARVALDPNAGFDHFRQGRAP